VILFIFYLLITRRIWYCVMYDAYQWVKSSIHEWNDIYSISIESHYHGNAIIFRSCLKHQYENWAM